MDFNPYSSVNRKKTQTRNQTYLQTYLRSISMHVYEKLYLNNPTSGHPKSQRFWILVFDLLNWMINLEYHKKKDRCYWFALFEESQSSSTFFVAASYYVRFER